MGIKSVLAKPLATIIAKSVEKQKVNALEDQEKIFLSLMTHAQVTEFGKEHRFEQITSYHEFTQAVPIRDYEQFKPYIEKIKEGKQNVLWKGKPIYLPKQVEQQVE